MSNDITNMMLKDSTDLLDNVEVSTIAAECIKLKQKEDEIVELEEKLKAKKLFKNLLKNPQKQDLDFAIFTRQGRILKLEIG